MPGPVQSWTGTARDPRLIKPQAPVQTVIPPADIHPQYEPATLNIKQGQADMSVDWTEVWENMGIHRPSTSAREQAAKSQQELAEDTAIDVRNGDRTRDINREKGNIFGKIAFETYMRKGEADTKIVTSPNFGPKIDIRVHPPQIKVNTELMQIGKPKGQ